VSILTTRSNMIISRCKAIAGSVTGPLFDVPGWCRRGRRVHTVHGSFCRISTRSQHAWTLINIERVVVYTILRTLSIANLMSLDA
jgi:hypothetical protein